MDFQSISLKNCPYCSECGGCDYIDIAYKDTLHTKLNSTKELLKSNDARPQNLEQINIVSSPKIFNYRNRCQLHIVNGNVGFFKRRSHDLIKIDNCLVLDERINERIRGLRFPSNYNGKIELYMTGNSVSERIVEKKYDNSFGQVNDHINSIIIEKAIALLNAEKKDNLLELYCGMGNFTFAIAEKIPGIKITGIDIKTPSTNRQSIEFLALDAEKGLRQLDSLNKLPSYNKVLLDPPRAGAGKSVSETIASMDVEKIVYISCNQETLAADANIICSKGFVWEQMELLDMFPFTKYVESINLFTKKML